MNAIQEIEKAIETLEQLKAKSTPCPWIMEAHPQAVVDVHYIKGVGERLWPHEVAVFYNMEDRADAELVTTLHRTIDAQLAILRDDYDICARHDWIPERLVLALARAINGTEGDTA